MTIEKIDETLTLNYLTLKNKLNEIVDWINEHDNSGRHIVPSNSLTGGEKPNKWCKMFNCDGNCKTKHKDQYFLEEPKSNPLREKLGLIAFDGQVEEILSHLKEYLEKEILRRIKVTRPDDSDIEWATKLQYNKAIYGIQKIIKNL